MKNRDWLKLTYAPRLQELLDRVEAVLTTGKLVISRESGPTQEVSIDSMSTHDKFCALRDCIDWRRYIDNGVSVEQAERIMNNALVGRPKEEWLEKPEFEIAKTRIAEREM
jgi:hypothetical protein